MTVAEFPISARRTIGCDHPTFVVAEIGQNHNGCVELAERLVDAAAWAGADAVKLVKRDMACELTAAASNRPYLSPHSFGATYGEHRRALELDIAVHGKLAQRVRAHGMHFLATVCDVPSAAQMHEIGVDCFKVASRDLGNLPLVEYVAALGRPVVLSTGMSDWREIDAAAAVLRRSPSPWMVLQCTSLYPTPDVKVHLRTMAELARRTRAVVGFSDHTLGIDIAPAAVALGAAMIEKHFTLDRNAKGSDHACSAEPEELRRLIEAVRRVEAALGRTEKQVEQGVEHCRRKLGRSLVTRSPISAGTIVDESMVELKSPGDGIAWVDRGLILGRRVVRDLDADSLIAPADVA